MNKLYPLIALVMILVFVVGMIAGAIVFKSQLGEGEYVKKLDSEANILRQNLIDEGYRIVNGSVPEKGIWLIEVKEWKMFKLYHQGVASDLPIIFWNEPIYGGHIPTFGFLYITTSTTAYIIYRVYW